MESHTFPVAKPQTKPSSRSREHRSSGTSRCLASAVQQHGVDGVVLGFIGYLMQCDWGDKINQGADTILDLKDEGSSKVIGECIFQCR